LSPCPLPPAVVPRRRHRVGVAARLPILGELSLIGHPRFPDPTSPLRQRTLLLVVHFGLLGTMADHRIGRPETGREEADGEKNPEWKRGREGRRRHRHAQELRKVGDAHLAHGLQQVEQLQASRVAGQSRSTWPSSRPTGWSAAGATHRRSTTGWAGEHDFIGRLREEYFGGLGGLTVL